MWIWYGDDVRDVLPSDIDHYLRITAFMNRFVWLFVVSSENKFACLQQSEDDAMRPPTIQKVAHTTSQEFFVSCLETCKVEFCCLSDL